MRDDRARRILSTWRDRDGANGSAGAETNASVGVCERLFDMSPTNGGHVCNDGVFWRVRLSQVIRFDDFNILWGCEVHAAPARVGVAGPIMHLAATRALTSNLILTYKCYQLATPVVGSCCVLTRC